MHIKDQLFGVMQRVGRAFMLPIAILPVAGLLLGIGASFTNQAMLESKNLVGVMGPGTIPYAILSVMAACGEVVFANLPLIFAVGVAIGMAKKEKEVAALASAVAFLVMHSAIGSLLTITGRASNLPIGSVANVLGIQSLQMGVFGGIIVGLGVASLHNRYYKIELPPVLSFFGGTRFVPIISSLTYAGVGIAAFFVWPFIQQGIFAVGDVVRGSGYFGTFIYGVMERALIPFGLHHVFYMPFWQTALGGSATINGVVVDGAQNIFFAELAAGNVTHFSVDATRFMSGKFPFMIFGLPGAALAMYRCAKPENRKVVGGLLVSAALTSILTGITEPIEFTFLFVSPLLYVIHCIFAGLSYMFMHILNVGVGMTFSGGFIDLLLFGVLQGNAKTNWINIILVGLIYFPLYYFVFRFMITKMKLKTPGREEAGEETKLYTRADVNAAKEKGKHGGSVASEANATSILILQGLGGKDNLSDVDSCATRLRVTVKHPEQVDELKLKQSGAAGVITKGNGVQVIYGPRVSVIKSALEDYMDTAESDHVMSLMNQPVDLDASASRQAVTDTHKERKEIPLYAPLSGDVIPLSEVPDDVFANEILGKGYAIKPTTGRVVAPVNCSVSSLTDTKHAFGLVTDDGLEILIHVGIDTVKLEGKYFNVKVIEDQKLKQGDLIADFDIDGIRKEGYEVTTPVIITNSDDYHEVKQVGATVVQEGDDFLMIR